MGNAGAFEFSCSKIYDRVTNQVPELHLRVKTMSYSILIIVENCKEKKLIVKILK